MAPKRSMLFEDFHGYSVPQVKVALARIFQKAAETAAVSVYLVTGIGNHVNPNGARGILKRILPDLLKPYALLIEKIEEEPAAYKITLKDTQRPEKRLVDSFFSQIEDTPLREFMISDLRERESRAQRGNVEQLVHVAGVYLCGMFPEFHDTRKGIDYYIDAIDLGSIEAARMLGYFYLYGSGDFKSDYKKAEKYLKLAAEKGEAEAQFLLGTFYLMGQAGYTDEPKGRQWIQRAADQNHVHAMQTLADSYFSGDFTEYDIDKAVVYLKKGVAACYERSQVGLARCYAGGQGVEKDLHKAFSLYQRAAATEEIYALFQLGEYHSDDRVGKKDPKKAFGYYMQAARLGDSDAMFRVGQSYLEGSGVDENREEGIVWLQKAVDRKNPHACYAMAGLCAKGENKNERLNERMKLLCDAATWGSAEALELIGFCLLEGLEEEPITSLVFSCLLKLAKATNSKAQTLLAYAYFTGKGTPINNSEGMKWLLASVDKKNSRAYYMLASRYAKDTEEPVKHLWFWYMRLAADEGESDAQVAIALALFHGDGASRDRVTSHAYMLQAAEQGVTFAKSLVGYTLINGADEIDKDEKAGVRWLREAADEGDVKAQYSVGVAFYNGHGANTDKALGFSYLLKAANQDFTPAQIIITQCYLSGDGVEENTDEAVKWLEKLADGGEPKACFILSQLYLPRSREQGFFDKGWNYLQMSVQKGFPPAQYLLGDMLTSSGRVVEGNALKQHALAQGYSPEQDIRLGPPLPPRRSHSSTPSL